MKSRWSRFVERLPIWLAAVTLLFTSVACGWFQRTGTPLLGVDSHWLIGMLHVEFLVVHSFPFLMMVAIQSPRLPQFQGLRVLGFGLLLLMYLTAAHAMAGWQGVGLFLSLTAVTYLGFFVNLEEGVINFRSWAFDGSATRFFSSLSSRGFNCHRTPGAGVSVMECSRSEACTS